MKTRARIIESAYKLIAEKGYNQTSIQMISDAIDIKKSLVYYYFDSKEELYFSLIEEFLSGSNAQTFNYDISVEGYKKELLSFGLNFIENYKSDEVFSSFVMEVYMQSKRIPELSDRMSGFHKSFKDELRNIINVGVNLKIIDNKYIESYVDFIYTIIHGIEFSIVFKTEIDHVSIWTDAVNKICVKGWV